MNSHRGSHYAGHYIPTLHTRSHQTPTKIEKSSRRIPEMEIVTEKSRSKPSRSKHKQVDKVKKRKMTATVGKVGKSHSRDHLVAPFPLLQLPRVELWCRNPQCTYNNKISHPSETSQPEPQNYSGRSNLPGQRYSHQSSVTSISTPLASDSNTTDTTLTIHSSSSGSPSPNENNSKMNKFTGVHEFYPGGARGRIPPPPKQVAAVNTIVPRTSTVKPNRGTSNPAASSASSCAGCRGQSQYLHDEESPIDDGKLDHPYATFWHLNNNFANLQTPTLKRDASVHSYGGFTLLNGHPGHKAEKKKSWQGFCSSHKIALVVSTFSLLVTLGLVVTLLLMKSTVLATL